MRPHTPTPVLLPFLLGVGVLCIYLLTLSCAHSGDDMQSIMQVEVAATDAPIIHPVSTAALDPDAAPRTRRLQPRYMLALPTETVLYRTAGRLGWAQSAVRPVQVAHALLGAFGIVCFCLALRQSVPERWSLAAGAGLSSSYAWWFYSTHLDYPIAAHALSCLFLYRPAHSADQWLFRCGSGGRRSLRYSAQAVRALYARAGHRSGHWRCAQPTACVRFLRPTP